jgi:hypothetical protein|tara:strand:+ start:2572 stop:3120 length:549 start_codon:yes stop_codon:yes gene_type:complete
MKSLFALIIIMSQSYTLGAQNESFILEHLGRWQHLSSDTVLVFVNHSPSSSNFESQNSEHIIVLEYGEDWTVSSYVSNFLRAERDLNVEFHFEPLCQGLKPRLSDDVFSELFPSAVDDLKILSKVGGEVTHSGYFTFILLVEGEVINYTTLHEGRDNTINAFYHKPDNSVWMLYSYLNNICY